MNLTEYRLEDIKDQNLISGKVDVEYTWTKVNIRRLSFSISWSKRFCQKLKFQDQDDEEEIRTEENNLLTSPFLEVWKLDTKMLITPPNILSELNFSTITHRLMSKTRKGRKYLCDDLPRAPMRPPNNNIGVWSIDTHLLKWSIDT